MRAWHHLYPALPAFHGIEALRAGLGALLGIGLCAFGVAVVAPGVATQVLPLAPSTSRATILPPGPVPVTLWRSTPKSLASLRA